jgi:hypothetical protein
LPRLRVKRKSCPPEVELTCRWEGLLPLAAPVTIVSTEEGKDGPQRNDRGVSRHVANGLHGESMHLTGLHPAGPKVRLLSRVNVAPPEITRLRAARKAPVAKT